MGHGPIQRNTNPHETLSVKGSDPCQLSRMETDPSGVVLYDIYLVESASISRYKHVIRCFGWPADYRPAEALDKYSETNFQ
jgi:hypothetical protein